jgi:diaminopimelate epimerase
MGYPRFEADEIPVRPALEPVAGQALALHVAGREVAVRVLSMGNPQCVVLLTKLPDESEFQLLGSALSVDPAFPKGTNVSFVSRESTHRIRIRIWERGVGPTHSSGTGCCGAAVAAILAGEVRSPVEVVTETGTQQVEWIAGSEVYLSGDACFVADLEWVGPRLKGVDHG